jgi:hypothetical protein
MAIRRLSTASISTGTKSNKLWDQDTQQGALVPIYSSTLSTNSSFAITNIPQTYRDLRIVLSARSALASGADYLAFWFNVFGAANLSITKLRGNGSTATSTRDTGGSYLGSTALLPTSANTVGAYGSYTIDIFGYSSNAGNKTFLLKGAADFNGSGETFLGAGLYATTNAITTMNIYGIKAGA